MGRVSSKHREAAELLSKCERSLDEVEAFLGKCAETRNSPRYRGSPRFPGFDVITPPVVEDDLGMRESFQGTKGERDLFFHLLPYLRRTLSNLSRDAETEELRQGYSNLLRQAEQLEQSAKTLKGLT